MKLGYDASSQRYTLNGYELHAGDPVKVINADGTKINSRIEKDEKGWYVAGFEDMYLEDLKVE